MDKYNLSYWEKTAFFDQVDVAIIGSGLVGLNAAIRLKEVGPNLNVVILERGALPIGASTRNAGFACFGSVTELLADYQTSGADAVWNLVEQRWKGLERLRNRVGDQALQYKAYGGYELFRHSEEVLFQRCMEHIPEFNKILKDLFGIGAYFVPIDEQIETFGFQGIGHLLLNKAEGQIHTGYMMKALLQLALQKGVQILNGVEVEALHFEEGNVAIQIDDERNIKARKIIIATNGFAQQLLPTLKVKPARNQVLITKPIPNLKIKGCFHYDQGYYYFRNIDQRILLGGGRNLALEEEQTTVFGTTATIQEALLQLLGDVILPTTPFEVDSWWSGILGVGDQKAPIIHKINDVAVVAVRLGGMGVALGSLVGENAADLIIES